MYGYAVAPSATILMKFYPLGSLTGYVKGKRTDLLKYPYSKRQLMKLLHGFAKAISYMHSVDISHQDIKPDNVLLEVGEQGFLESVVTDFGISRVLNTQQLLVQAFKVS